MKRTIASAALVLVTLVGCSSAAAVDPTTPDATASPVATPDPTPRPTVKPTPKPTPTPTPAVEPMTMADVEYAERSKNCVVIIDTLGDGERLAATSDRALLDAALEIINRCTATGVYQDPDAVPEDTSIVGAPPSRFGKGFAVEDGEWTIRLTEVNWNAGKALQNANMFNDPIPKGMTAVMIAGEVTYNGTERGDFETYGLKAVGQSGIEYTTSDDPSCGVMPEPNLRLDGNTLRQGASQSGWLACWVVDNDDLDSLEAFYEPMFSFTDDITPVALR